MTSLDLSHVKPYFSLPVTRENLSHFSTELDRLLASLREDTLPIDRLERVPFLLYFYRVLETKEIVSDILEKYRILISRLLPHRIDNNSFVED